MKKLIGVFALLLAVFIGVTYLGRKKGLPSLLWPEGNSVVIEKLVIEYEGKKAVLAKKDGKWRVQDPMDYPADERALEQIENKLKTATISESLTENPEKHSLFEVDREKGIHLQAYPAAGSPGLDVYIGKTGSDYTSVYLRFADKPGIYEAKGIPRYHLDKAPKDWLSRTVCVIPSDEIRHLKIKTAQGTVNLERRGKEWRMRDEKWDTLLSTAAVSKILKPMLARLIRFELDRVELSSDVSLPKKETRLEGFLEISVEWKDSGEKDRSLNLKTAGKSPDNFFYMKKAGEERVVYLVSGWRLDPFRKSPTDFKF